jgi:uncharacterized caspase-like protein
MRKWLGIVPLLPVEGVYMVTLLRAVVVGVDEYMDKRYREQARLQFASTDAEAIASTLNISSVLRLEQMYLHKNIQASRKTVQNSLNEVFSNNYPGQNTMALFYFAGHGIYNRKDERISLCCYDTDFSDPNIGGIRLNDIYELLSQCSAEYAIAIIDSCYSGGIIDSSYFYHVSPAEHAKRAIEALRGTSDKTMAIFAACRENQKARESKISKHGLYTHALLQGWRDGQARGSDGSVTLFGLADHVTRLFAADRQIPRVSILGSKPLLLWQGEPPPPAPMVSSPLPSESHDGSIIFKPGTGRIPRKNK